jgi:hypothetical protein
MRLLRSVLIPCILLAAVINRMKSVAPGDMLEAIAGVEQLEGGDGVIDDSSGSRIPRKSVSIFACERGKRRLVRQLVPSRTPAPGSALAFTSVERAADDQLDRDR